jgi:uncharacterized damage-inducible protein DinB
MESQFLYKAWANKQTLREIEKIDRVRYPDKLTMAIRLFNHTHVVDKIFIAHLTDTSHPYTATNTKDTPSIKDLRQSVEKADHWLIEFSKNVSPSELNNTINFTFTDGDTGSMSIRDILSHLVIHGAYHRGNIGMLLADCELERPNDTFTRFLHNYAPNLKL